jgi:nicotinamidase/pyrazinamidase
MDDLIIVDCQADFIDGSLACQHSHEAVDWLVHFANTHDVRVLYTSDWHSPSNHSFKIHGGPWPVHCVAGTKGAELDPAFSRIAKESNRPQRTNRFLKGRNDEVEEYSAYYGENEEGTVLADIVSPHVYVGGIASEYCVRETVLSLLKAGHTVTLLVPGLGYVNEKDHEKSIADLAQQGVRMVGYDN